VQFFSVIVTSLPSLEILSPGPSGALFMISAQPTQPGNLSSVRFQWPMEWFVSALEKREGTLACPAARPR
jgi:hypothetical protein